MQLIVNNVGYVVNCKTNQHFDVVFKVGANMLLLQGCVCKNRYFFVGLTLFVTSC